MWIPLSLLFVLSFVSTSIRLSLSGFPASALLIPLAFSLGVFALYPAAAQINIQALEALLQSYSTFSSFCTLLILEGTLLILLTSHLIRAHFSASFKWYDTAFMLCPSLTTFAGAFVLQNYIFHMDTRLSFLTASALFSFGFFCVFTLLVFLLRFVLRDWIFRLHLGILLTYVQLIIAMYLPLLLTEVRVHQSHLGVDGVSIAAFFFIFFLFCCVGYTLPRIRWRRIHL